jgi:hypothetical protein
MERGVVAATPIWCTMALLALGCLSVGCFLPFHGEPPEGPSLLYLVPESFSGWSCTDFGVVGAPPLEQEGDAFVIRPRMGEVLKTSHTKKDLMFARTESYFEGSSPRRAFPLVRVRSENFQEDTNHPVARYCLFFGKPDDRGEVPTAPELRFDKEPRSDGA